MMSKKKADMANGTQPPWGTLYSTDVKYTPSKRPKRQKKANAKGHGQFQTTSITKVTRNVVISILGNVPRESGVGIVLASIGDGYECGEE